MAGSNQVPHAVVAELNVGLNRLQWLSLQLKTGTRQIAMSILFWCEKKN